MIRSIHAAAAMSSSPLRARGVFVPHSLPRVAEGEWPVVRLVSATHYFEGIELVRRADSPMGVPSSGAMRQWSRRRFELDRGGHP
jgi:hypothetical protein